jgi:hypothetical protein
VLLTIATHVRGLQGQFVEWDDTSHITQNVFIRTLTLKSIRAMFTEPVAKLYCPLTWLSFAVDYRIWGRDPFGYHFTNLLLHVVNTLLVLVLAYRLVRDRAQHAIPVALLTGALFGVHPLWVESVAWATERKDVLFGFFFLLGLLAHLSRATGGRRSAYWISFGCFIASALAKPAAITFPVVLLLLDAFWARRIAWREKIPFFIVAVIIGAANFVAQASGKGETVAGAEVVPLWARLGLVGYCSLFYVKKFLWPTHLSAIYPTFDELGWTPLTAVGYLLAFTVVTAAVVALRKRAPVLLSSWLFYLITLSPTIGLVPVGIHVVADRFSYLPLVGLAFPVSMGLVAIGQRSRATQVAAGGVSVALLVALTVLSARRTAVWANTGTLFRNALAENPRCLPAHVNLTIWYTSHKQFDKAIAHGRAAVAIAPNDLRGRKNLAYALVNAGHQRETIDVLRVLAEHNVDDPDVWRALAECFEAVGDQPNANAAKEHLRKLTAGS